MFNSWLENRILNKLADRLLPLVSTSDVGKSPVVTLGEEQGVLILPETTIVKAEGEYPSVSADTSGISVGDKLIVTIDDTTKTLEVLAGELAPYVHFDTDFEISFGEDAITFFVVNMDTGTEFTAEIYKAEAVAEWSLGSGGGGGGDNVVILSVDVEHGLFNDDTTNQVVSFLYPVINETGEAISFDDATQLLTDSVLKINMPGLWYNNGALIPNNDRQYSDICVFYSTFEYEDVNITGVIGRTITDVSQVENDIIGLQYVPDPINSTGNLYCTGAFKYLAMP